MLTMHLGAGDQVNGLLPGIWLCEARSFTSCKFMEEIEGKGAKLVSVMDKH